MQKNVSGQKWIVFAFDKTTNTPKTGDAVNITANLRLDGGAANPVDTTNPTELEGGYYYFPLTAAETNGDMIVICPSSSTSDIVVIGVPGAIWTVMALSALADALWDEVLHTDHEVAGSASVLLQAAGGAADPLLNVVPGVYGAGTAGKVIGDLAAEIDSNSTQLAAVLIAIGGLGTGPTAHPYTVSVNSVPCADVLVIMTTDLAGSVSIHSGRTNALGQITFYPDLPAGTPVYLWRYKTGVTFVNPDVEAV
jgi:hypothetical protein